MKKDRKERVHMFESIQEARQQKASELNSRKVEMSLNAGRDKSWFGVKDLDSVYKALDNGWATGVKKMQQLSESIDAPAPQSIKRRLKRDSFGDSIDMQQVYIGNLEKAWSRRQRRQSRGPKLITLAVDIGANSNVKAERLFWRGASALKLAELLIEAGYQVQIIAYHRGRNVYYGEADGRIRTDLFIVKPFQAPIDLNNIASVICLSGFFRTVGFTILGMDEEAELTSGFGQSHNETPDNLEGDYIISDFHTVGNQWNAEDKIKAELKKLQPEIA